MPFNPEEMNLLLDRRIKDVAARRPADSLPDHQNRVRHDRPVLMRCLGLEPLPDSTELQASITGTIERNGYRIEKIAYNSRPGFTVTAHLYLPAGTDKSPLVLRPHGHWPGKKSEIHVQASAIGLVLAGYAVFVIDAPGDSGEPPELNERAHEGPHNDPWLQMGRPYEGFYVWDMMRAIDYLSTRSEIDASRIGITGASGGGLASMYTFAVDERITCCAPVCFGASMEVMPHNGCLCNHVPGILALGDRADIFGLRAPAPILLVGATDDPEFPPEGMKRTFEKLRTIYHRFDHQPRVRLEIVEASHDYNRRMREAVLAFFDEHLKGASPRGHTTEVRPITDGYLNPSPAETVDPADPSLGVLQTPMTEVRTMRSFVEEALRYPGREELDIANRLVPWAKYGRANLVVNERVLLLDDDKLDLEKVDQRICIYLGLGVCEAYAQLIHMMVPGGAEGWETSALGPTGDVMTSLIGSMKALIGSTAAPIDIVRVRATGPAASLIASFLSVFRPALEIQKTHEFSDWSEIYRLQKPELAQPLASYYRWPFKI